MCGIVGYAGKGEAALKVFSGLEQLEYRGYDSAGIAVSDGHKINIVKKCGRVRLLKARLNQLTGGVGIGHTRWATHGKPSDVNAHPHASGAVVVVHNGILENYSELKNSLSAAGARFVSETDSEVIAASINAAYSRGNCNFCAEPNLCDPSAPHALLRALHTSAQTFKGSYALMVMCEGFEGFAVARFKSPVIVGAGDDGFYCASDEPALAGSCSSVYALQDGEYALITPSGIRLYDCDLSPVERKFSPNRARSAAFDLCGNDRYMIKEICESPAAVKNTVSAFASAEGDIDGIRRADRFIFLGCGTAYHAALMGKIYLERFARATTEAEYAGEFRYKDPVLTPRSAVIAVTQSGETADTVEAAKLAKTLGARVIAVTNSPRSEITRVADAVVPVEAGTEICVAATKSYSGQLVALYMLAKRLAGESFSEICALPDALGKVIKSADICALADMCARASGVYFLGRNADYALALEGSLKMREVTYIAGGGYPAGELKHGTLALIDENTVSVFIITDGELASKSATAAEQVLSRGGKVAIVTCCKGIAAAFAGRAETVEIPDLGKYLTPVLAATVLQKLAYRTAVILGRDPDKPRHLAKSVTVE